MFRLLVVALAMFAGPAWADGVPAQSLQPYTSFKAKMVEAGWVPVIRPNDMGTEIDCEIRVPKCYAHWQDPTGKRTWIDLEHRGGANEFYVIPN